MPQKQPARATRHSRHRADAASARLFQRLEKKLLGCYLYLSTKAIRICSSYYSNLSKLTKQNTILQYWQLFISQCEPQKDNCWNECVVPSKRSIKMKAYQEETSLVILYLV